MTPELFEAILFLHINRDFWDDELVHKAIESAKIAQAVCRFCLIEALYRRDIPRNAFLNKNSAHAMIANLNMCFEHKHATKWEELFIASNYYINNNHTVAIDENDGSPQHMFLR